MKYYLIPFLILLAGCGSGPKGGTTTTDNVITNNVDSVGDSKFNADTGKIATKVNPNSASDKSATSILFVGEFATWRQSGGDNFNGLYDSTQSLFSFCSTNKVQHVIASQISYAQFATCDTTNSKRVMMLMKYPDGQLNPNGVSLNVVGDHAEVIGDPSRIIKLSPAVVERINAAKVNRRQPADGKTTPTILVPPQSLKDNQKIIDSVKLMQINQPKQQGVDPQKMNSTLPKNHVIQKVETEMKAHD